MQVESEDYLQDIVFDYYGNKMAICGSDRKIKIFEKTDTEEGYVQVATWDVINFN